MGKFKDATGAISGLVGPVIFSSWREIPYMKHKGIRSKKPPSEKQLQHQAKVGMISTFVYSMRELLDKTFINFAIKKTGTNAAFSYNFKNAVAGDQLPFSINYSLVLVSRGDLPNATEPVAIALGNGEVQFRWTDNSGTGQAKATDKCIGVIHCPELQSSIFSNGATIRKAGSTVLAVPRFAGKLAETWLVFLSQNGTEVANSVYTGQLAVL